MKHCAGIYQIRNTINGNIYIGQTQDMIARRDNHFTKLKYNKHHTPHLQAAYNKYGIDNFLFEPLVYCEIFELDRIEQELINRINPAYNSLQIVSPGLRGYRFSEETKKKMSLSQTGHFVSDETREKQSRAKLGKKLSEEQMANHKNLFQKGHKINVGRKLSDEQKESISLRHSGKILSEETKRKIGEANKRIQAEKKNRTR